MTASIEAFLNERKELWLKDRLKKAENETVIAELQQQANERFSLQEWLPDAAKRVSQLSMVSHPSKFSHPSAKTSSVIVQAKHSVDGYLRSGNVNYPLDVFGNAAAMDVFKFLSVNLDNGQTVLDAFEKQDEDLKQFIQRSSLDFDVLRLAFLVIKDNDTSVKTDHLVKQVYFPIGEKNYHLLSLLTPSGLITKLKQSIDAIRFSDATKLAKDRRKKNELDKVGYADIYDLTVTAYGGTQPQNVSVLNSQNAGRAYLLSSAPPQFEKRTIRLPKTDFFAQSLYRKNFQDSFLQLHKLMQLDVNNIDIRTAIRNIIQFVIDQVMFQAFKIRQSYAEGWSNEDYYASLPKLQRVWLDDFYENEREQDDEWRDELSREIARWILRSYEKSIEGSFTLGTGELVELKQRVEKSLQQTKEFF
ncbi:CRISPR type I-f/ypest-associated protein csy1 [Acinetobacter bohemicus ANC 3994]|uniref:CRISPR type I-f/ypest-associated protein csy1 n=1 Tax=Acinetobacter bohemicus ANC 3994 TaxID=1217715 RepID=N8QCA7_9GAMM|nr:type I-F CRISPR-associated protein Csy1 [Acinetobacter bohemicus]ENU20823.1 CRISPR type I-f/ypest-associated protein csy1 [Acinetobacter bohemicus ANC 3994]